MSTQDTTKIDGVSLQDRIAALDDYLDKAMRDPDMEVDRDLLNRERNLIAYAMGGEGGRIAQRISELAEVRSAALHARAEHERKEAGIVWEREINGVRIVMDGDFNMALTDFKDETEAVIELPKRTAVAMATFWAELIAHGIRAIKEEEQAAERADGE